MVIQTQNVNVSKKNDKEKSSSKNMTKNMLSPNLFYKLIP